nr:hypothetical protein [Giesbergeria sp.]
IHIAGASAGATESAAVTFQAMEAGDSITVAGLTFTASASTSAANVAVQFAALGTNSLTGFTSAAAQGAAVTFTSTTPNDNVTNMGLTSSSAKTAHTPTVVTTEGASAASFVTVVTAQGVPGPADTSVVVHQGAALPGSNGFSRGNETTTSERFLSAKELFSGQSLSIAGLKLTATADMTREEVASAFGGLTVGSTVGKAPVKGNWSGELAGYQTLAYTSGSKITVATLAPSSELIDINNLGLQATGPTENSVVTFGAMSAGQVLSVGGLTLSATGDIAAADVATAFASLSAGDSGGAGINGTWQGALSAFTSAAAVGDTVTFTSTTANGNVTDLPVLSGRTETTTVTFKDLAAGQSITVGGLTLTTTNNIGAWQVADEFNDLVAGTTAEDKSMMSGPSRTWSGTLTGFTSKNEGDGGGYGPSSTTVTFTSTTPGQNVADLVVTATGPGTESTVGSTETASVTFQALTNGDSITVAGLTLTATGNVSAEDAAAGFAGLQAGDSSGNTVANANWSGTALTGFNAGTAAGAVVVFTSTSADTDVANIAISSARDTSAFAPAVVTTDGKPSGPSDSYALNGDYSTMDTIVNFSLANDTLALPSKDVWVPSGTVGTGSGSASVNIDVGMATFTDTSLGVQSKIDGLLYALGTNQAAVAFVDGGNTYVLYGDGVQGTQDSDIVVLVTGVAATSLATAASGNALVLV